MELEHSNRFRKVSTRYPRRVAEAYVEHGGIAQAARETDAMVAACVAEWERAHGLPVRDWVSIGREEREETDAPPSLTTSTATSFVAGKR